MPDIFHTGQISIAQGLQLIGLYHLILSLLSRSSQLRQVVSQVSSQDHARDPLIVFILGPPGAGKETHSNELQRLFSGLTHLSFGDLVRYEAAKPGSWVSIFPRRGGTSSGDPVLPPRDAVRLLRDTIKAGVAMGQLVWLVDGFPRSREHMSAWATTPQMPKVRGALYLSCDPSIAIARILGCASTSGRPDDANSDNVRERVSRNIIANKEMLQACKEHHLEVTEINADRAADAVLGDVRMHFQAIKEEWEREPSSI
ncbi:P-loop containing nucleoside triphosphate hydrolase protein [Xylariaceae sp. FL1272]|nr:P-loop containing nucleoside triphosphate hydrolase protein [Xylariaceae sp. FL1272]